MYLIGTGLLWFGWFGFNAGSAVGAGSLGVYAFATTNTAAAAAGLSWMFLMLFVVKNLQFLDSVLVLSLAWLPSHLPQALWVFPQALFIGFVAAIVSNVVAEFLKSKTKFDDPLDVFACHGLGGIDGMLMTGVFGSKTGKLHLVFDGQFLIQLKGMATWRLVYSFIVSFIIFKVINLILPMRVTQEEEAEGLDASQHDEKYLQGTLLVHNNGNVEERTLAD